MSRGRGFQQAWWLVLITLGVMYTAAIPFMFALSADSFLYMLCGEGVLIIPLIVGVFMIFWENPSVPVSEQMGLRGFPMKLLPYILLLAVAAKGFSAIYMSPIQILLSSLLGTPDYSDIEAGVLWQNFVVLCIMAPVLEEAICRGVLMRLFGRYGSAAALVFSSLAFAIMHQSAQSFVVIFFLGMLLGTVRITTGSIFAAMLVHSLSNMLSLAALSGADTALTTVIMLAAAVSFPFVLYAYMKKASECVRFPKTEKFAPTGFSVALVIVCVLFVLFNIGLMVSNILDSGLITYDLFSGEMMY